MLSMREEIKTLKNQIETKQNVWKYTESINEDFPGLTKNLRRSDKQIALFERTQTSIKQLPTFREVAKVGKSLFFYSFDTMISFFKLILYVELRC